MPQALAARPATGATGPIFGKCGPLLFVGWTCSEGAPHGPFGQDGGLATATVAAIARNPGALGIHRKKMVDDVYHRHLASGAGIMALLSRSRRFGWID